MKRGSSALHAAALMLFICAVCVLAAVMLGSYVISPAGLWEVMIGQELGFERTVVLNWRLPRAIAAIGVGACLGLSGALLQTVTRNPLASPDLIGISGGSYTAVLFMVTISGASWALVGSAALVGGLVAAAIVFLVSGAGRGRGAGRFLLSGVAVAAFLGGINSWIVQSASLESAMAAAAWGAGSLAAATWKTVWFAGLALLVCGVWCAIAASRIRVHALGDEVAVSLGVRPRKLRTEMLIVAVVLVAVATSLCGPIGLLPLVAPPISRALARREEAPFFLTALVGAALLVLADLLAQHVLPGGPPAGLVTTVLGGAYLMVLLVRRPVG